MIRNLNQLMKVLHVKDPKDAGTVLSEALAFDGRCELEDRGVLLIMRDGRRVPVAYPFKLQFLEIVALAAA